MGLNDEVVKTLVKLYLNEPQDRLGVNLRPFLSEHEKLAADYEVSNFCIFRVDKFSICGF